MTWFEQILNSEHPLAFAGMALSVFVGIGCLRIIEILLRERKNGFKEYDRKLLEQQEQHSEKMETVLLKILDCALAHKVLFEKHDAYMRNSGVGRCKADENT